MMVKKIFLMLSLCAILHVQPNVTENYIASTNRPEAMYEILATEAKQLTFDRKNQLLECANKAIVQRKRETGIFHMWRDYSTLAYSALFAIPTAKAFSNLGQELKKTLDREAAGIQDNAPIGLIFAAITCAGAAYVGLPFSIIYCSKLLNRTLAKERLADAQFIKKTIERLPVV